MSNLDAIIVGAGHNGLTCAAYLGMAGLRVRVFERRSVVGGACVTEEFHPGFRNSTAAYRIRRLPHAGAGLYLCGSGAHPGGGVTGALGHNAAQAVISDLLQE
jgi:phytoene dehydrogenase-like protein